MHLNTLIHSYKYLSRPQTSLLPSVGGVTAHTIRLLTEFNFRITFINLHFSGALVVDLNRGRNHVNQGGEIFFARPKFKLLSPTFNRRLACLLVCWAKNEQRVAETSTNLSTVIITNYRP